MGHKVFIEVQALNKSLMRTEDPQDWLTQKLRIDLGEIIGQYPWDRLIGPVYTEFAKSVTETKSKVREPKTYDEAINNSIYENWLKKVIDEELWILDSHQM